MVKLPYLRSVNFAERKNFFFSVSESRQEGQRELDTVAVQAAAEEEDWAAKGPAFLETP